MYVVCSPQLLAVYVFAVSFRIRPNASSSLSISRGLLLLSVEPWRDGPFHRVNFQARKPTRSFSPILQTSTCHPKTSLATGQKFAEI